MAFILYNLKYIWEVSPTLDYIHRFIYIRLMKGHVAGGATFHQGVLLDYLHQIPFKNVFLMSMKQGIDKDVTICNVCNA